MESKNLAGMTFGRWQVMDIFRDWNGQKQWLCQCSCEAKTLRYVNQANLLSGKTKSCGCLSIEKAKSRCLNLKGRDFGALKVISKAENKRGRTAWNCLCKCGNISVVTTHELMQDKTKSCGCGINRKGKNIRDLRKMELEGLEILYPTEERNYKGSVMWHCRCKKCGKEKDFSEDVLINNNYKSCGCDQYSYGKQLEKHKHLYKGTCVEALERKIRSDNTSGVIGVSETRNGKYKASIAFQGIVYPLGTYETLGEAASVRKRAKEQLHDQFIKAYANWMGDTNPCKKELVFDVEFIGGEFLIQSNYLLEQREIVNRSKNVNKMQYVFHKQPINKAKIKYTDRKTKAFV